MLHDVHGVELFPYVQLAHCVYQCPHHSTPPALFFCRTEQQAQREPELYSFTAVPDLCQTAEFQPYVE